MMKCSWILKFSSRVTLSYFVAYESEWMITKWKNLL